MSLPCSCCYGGRCCTNSVTASSPRRVAGHAHPLCLSCLQKKLRASGSVEPSPLPTPIVSAPPAPAPAPKPAPPSTHAAESPARKKAATTPAAAAGTPTQPEETASFILVRHPSEDRLPALERALLRTSNLFQVCVAPQPCQVVLAGDDAVGLVPVLHSLLCPQVARVKKFLSVKMSAIADIPPEAFRITLGPSPARVAGRVRAMLTAVVFWCVPRGCCQAATTRTSQSLPALCWAMMKPLNPLFRCVRGLAPSPGAVITNPASPCDVAQTRWKHPDSVVLHYARV